MEIANVKRYVCRDALLNKIYISRSLGTLFDNVELARDYIGLMGVLDTSVGEVLFSIEESYSYEPILLHRIMHYDTFMRFFPYAEIIDLDKL